MAYFLKKTKQKTGPILLYTRVSTTMTRRVLPTNAINLWARLRLI